MQSSVPREARTSDRHDITSDVGRRNVVSVREMSVPLTAPGFSRSRGRDGVGRTRER